MRELSFQNRTRVPRSVAVCFAVPLAMCAILLTGCSGGDEPAGPSEQASKEGSSLSEGGGEDLGNGSVDESAGGRSDVEIDVGDVKVGTQIPEGFPADLPLPQKAPTSVVTVGDGGETIGGGWALNYDGVSLEEVEQVLQKAESAGYDLSGQFESGSSNSWALRKDKMSVLVLFSDDANLSLTVTKTP